MAHYMVVLLDETRLNELKGTPVEEKIVDMFGGALKAINIDVPEDVEKKIMEAFTSARIDSRGAVTDVPVAFNRVLFEEIAKNKSIGKEVWDGVLARLDKIKEDAAKESSYLPAPEINISDIEELQKEPYQKP